MPPGRSAPDCSAASIIRTAIRSLTEPPGLKYSTFASTVADNPEVTELSLTRGVSPIRSSMDSWYRTEPPHECASAGAGWPKILTLR